MGSGRGLREGAARNSAAALAGVACLAGCRRTSAAARLGRRAGSPTSPGEKAPVATEQDKKKKVATPTADWKRDNPEQFEALDAATKYVVGMYAYAEEWNENPEKFRKPFEPGDQLGATAPLGFFDPLGFTKTDDKEGFRRYRELELKHGRIAMMAAGGAVTQSFIKLPGFEEVPSGMAALTTPPGTYGFLAVLLLSGALELYRQQNPIKEQYSLNLEVGDEPNRPAFFVGDDFLATDYFHTCELNNGRFAMFSALGIILAELVSGKTAIQQLEYLAYVVQ